MKKITLDYIDSNMAPTQTDEIIEPAINHATGFLVKETDKFITICLEWLDTNGYMEYRNQVSIPKVAVTERLEEK